MDPGKAGHIAGLVVGTSERTLTSSSSVRGAEREEKGGLGSGANGAKMASTGPPSWPRHDPPPERLQKVLRARAPRHLRGTAHTRHSKGPPRVGTVPGPLPTSSAAGLGPDQCEGSRLAAPTSPEGREATPRRRTDVGRGGGQL